VFIIVKRSKGKESIGEMFGYKKLKRRIASLEDGIGLIWDDVWKVHEKVAGGRLARFDDIVDEEKKIEREEKFESR